MAFHINKTLGIRLGPFEHSVDLLILEKTEELIRQEKRNPYIKIFNVTYKEFVPPLDKRKPGFRYFKILDAFNERDK